MLSEEYDIREHVHKKVEMVAMSKTVLVQFVICVDSLLK